MEYKWYLGIDISKRNLDIVIFQKDKMKKSPHIRIDNSALGFEHLLLWFEEQSVILKETLVCMEHTGVYGARTVAFLSEKTTCCVESPLHIKRSLGLVRGKNDKADAYQISRFCYLHREELKPVKIASDVSIKLKNLLNERDRLVKSRQVDRTIVNEFDNEDNKSSIIRAKKRILSLSEDIKEIQEEMETTIHLDHEMEVNYKLVKSVVGIGLVNAVTFILYTNNFTTITDARKYAAYSGVAPFEHTSGSSIRGRTKVSKLANQKIKVNLTNGARSAIINDPELKLYYCRKKEEGKDHGTVMNAVKFKLISRVFATVKRGTPFVKLRQAG
jgi:transposase